MISRDDGVEKEWHCDACGRESLNFRKLAFEAVHSEEVLAHVNLFSKGASDAQRRFEELILEGKHTPTMSDMVETLKTLARHKLRTFDRLCGLVRLWQAENAQLADPPPERPSETKTITIKPKYQSRIKQAAATLFATDSDASAADVARYRDFLDGYRGSSPGPTEKSYIDGSKRKSIDDSVSEVRADLRDPTRRRVS